MEEGRRYPAWHQRAGESPAPSLFVSDRCVNLIEQLQGRAAGDERAGADAVGRTRWRRSRSSGRARTGTRTPPAATAR